MFRAAILLAAPLVGAAGVSARPTALAPSPPPEAPVQLPLLEISAAPFASSRLDLPAAVASFDGDFLAGNRADTVAALAPFVPGFFASEQSVNIPGYSIRGITTDNTDPRSEERVALFQDGVPISRTSGASVALFDIERIEIVKGPEPTRFVRGAQAGAVSILSRTAENRRASSLTLGVGDHSATFAEGFVNTPLVEDRLFARGSFHLHERDGFVDNLVPGAENLQGVRTAALRLGLRWQPAERTTLDLTLQLQRDRPPGVAFQSMDIPTSLGDTSPYSPAELNRGSALGIDRTIRSLAATLRTELSPAWTLRSTTAGRRFDSREEFDADGSRFYLFEVGTDQRAEQLSQEIRLDYDAGDRLTGGIGLAAFWEKGRQNVRMATDERRAWALLSPAVRANLVANGVPPATAELIVPPLDPFAPAAALPSSLPAAFALVPQLAPYAGAPLSPRHQERYVADNDHRSLELLGDAEYRLAGRFFVGASLRLVAESIESGYESIDSRTGALGFIQAGGSGNLVYRPTPGRLSATDDNIGWAGRVHARQELAKTHEGFAAVSRGRRPPSLFIDQATLEETRLAEETLVNHEIGLRGALAPARAAYSVSVFQYYYENFQTRVVRGPGLIGADDAGRARGRGFEASLRGSASDHLALFGAYGFTDARISALDGDGAPQAYAGNRFRLSPVHTLALGATLALPAAGRGAFHLSPVFQYKSGVFFEDDNALSGGRLRQGGHGIVNLTLAYRPARGAWEAAIFADNLLDRDHLIDAGNIGASFGLPTTVRGAPRTLGARLTARF